MHHNLPLRISAILLSGIITLGLLQVGYAKSDGAPSGNTGSPDDGQTCANTGCHTGTASSRDGMITTDVPVTGYLAGETYTVTVTITEPGVEKFGFQASPQSPSGSLLGEMILINTVETKLTGAGKYITHTSDGTAGEGTRTWTFQWTPEDASGDVSIYTAVNASNNEDNASGDRIFFDMVSFIEDPSNTPVDIQQTNPIEFSIVSQQNDLLMVNVVSPVNDAMRILVTDLSGKTLYTGQYAISNGSFAIPVNEFAGGMYIVTLMNTTHVSSRKVMIN